MERLNKTLKGMLERVVGENVERTGTLLPYLMVVIIREVQQALLEKLGYLLTTRSVL